MSLERLAVVYDVGAAVPTDILGSFDGIADPVFVLPETGGNAELREMLSDLAHVATVDNVADFAPSGITTFSDFQLETTALLAERLGLPFHSRAAAHDIVHKHRQRTVLNQHGVGHTPTALVTDRRSARAAAALVPLPGVLKPNRGVGGSNTYSVESADELFTLVDDLIDEAGCVADHGYVLESLLRGIPTKEPWGSYVSVESMICAGDIRHLGITGKFSLSPPYRERGGYVPPQPGTFDETAVLELTTRALKALSVGDSVCHTELMLTEDGPRIIEVNGRVGGYIHDLFRRGYGHRLVELAGRIALGQTPRIEPGPAERVAFHYIGLAPLDARQFVAADGIADARSLPEVDRLDLGVVPGTPLDWRRGFRDRIYACRGKTSTYAELATLVDGLDEILQLRYR
jgi:biotin carboxylase